MTDAIKEFWKYFEENKFVFRILNEVSKEIQSEKIEELHRLINVFHPHIGFLIKLEKVIPELIITAYGNPYLFKSVELLYNYAPVIENWKITAFVQPIEILDNHKSGSDAPFYFHGLELKISELRFIAFPLESNPYLISIDLYLPKRLKKEHPHKIVGIIYIILEKVLGEKAFANEIHSVNICSVDDSDGAVTIPLWMLISKLNLNFPNQMSK